MRVEYFTLQKDPFMAFTREGVGQTSTFSNYAANEKLQALSKHPINLTEEGVLTPERLQTFYGESCGYKLLYGTEQVTEPVMHALVELAEEARLIEKMRRMQSGEIVNFIENYPSENRPALHTATRDFFDHPNQGPEALKAAQQARQETEKLRSFMAKIDLEKKFNEMIVVAIGGSDLGPKAHYLALEYLKKSGRNVYFISNVDPDDGAAILKKADLKNCLVVIVSKSGTTLETATNEELVREYFKKQNLDPKKQFISVTCPGTPMDNPENYLETFHMWEWIGGRYSTTSMAGGVMLSFAFGFEVYEELLKGAHAMDLASLQPDIRHNLPLLAALLGVWNHNFLGYPTLALIPYSQALLRYPAHIQQVEMESNGKLIEKDGRFVDFQTGAIVWGEPGTNAQHSFFQLLHQGTATIPVEMIGFKETQYESDIEFRGTTCQEKLLSNLFAQSLALALGQNSENPNTFFPGNRPSHILLGKKLTPYALGALLSFFENKAVFHGFIWNINSFDQEGVQLGKVLANKIIDCFAERRKEKQASTGYPFGDVYLNYLDHLE